MDHPTEPSPKSNVKHISEKTSWAITSVLKDVKMKLSSSHSFDQVFASRRTQRVFDPVSLRETRGFIQHNFAMQSQGTNAQAGRVRKGFISPGALHPVDIIILSGPDVDEPIWFDDMRSKFATLPVLDQSSFETALDQARIIQPNAKGHLLMFVGDVRRVSASYTNSESLLWRDAGAALQVCSMSAYAYGYAFCPLGYTGKDLLSAIGAPNNDYRAVGLATFGKWDPVSG